MLFKPLPRTLLLTGLLAIALMAVAACGGDDDPTATPTTEPQPTATAEPDPTGTPEPDPTGTPQPDPTGTPEPGPTATTEPEPTETAEPGPLPGEGVTVRPGRATWDTGWFTVEVINEALRELGYEVEEPTTLQVQAFFTALAQGDLDYWPNTWLPLHNTFVEPVDDRVTIAGELVSAGALQGYLIDKATADEYGITNLEDLKDPEIAALFDTDGNGRANLTGCDPGWGCELVIEHHLDAYELRDYVDHDQGFYSVLMADTISRYNAGQPILWYTWTPNWTVAELVPGEDVVWIEVPFVDLPEDQADLADAATIEGVPGCVNDPCAMGWPGNDITIAANDAFLADNPAVERLFAAISIPLNDIADQNVRMFDGEDSDSDIRAHAQEWIEQNRETFDSWIAAALDG